MTFYIKIVHDEKFLHIDLNNAVMGVVEQQFFK